MAAVASGIAAAGRNTLSTAVARPKLGMVAEPGSADSVAVDEVVVVAAPEARWRLGCSIRPQPFDALCLSLIMCSMFQ